MKDEEEQDTQMTERGVRLPFDKLTAYGNQRKEPYPQMAQMNADREPLVPGATRGAGSGCVRRTGDNF